MCLRVRVFQDTSSMNLPALFYKIKLKKKEMLLSTTTVLKNETNRIARFGDF